MNASSLQEPPVERPRVVVVADDEAANRALVQAALEAEGYTVVLAHDGRQAVHAVHTVHPDCLLIDVRMPVMDGLAACRALRARPETRELPILVLTAYRDVDTFDQAIEAGADDFLTKPLRVSELLVRLSSLLTVRRLDSELRRHVEQVRAQRDELYRTQLQKDRLSSFVVHDLKGPITTIGLLASSAQRDASLSPRAQRSVRAIESEAGRLSRMVHNLLDIAKAEEGQLEPVLTEQPLLEIVEAAVEAVRFSAELKGVSVQSECDPGLRVRVDLDLFARVLANLVENAVRHTPAAGRVTVRGEALPNGGTRVLVADTGEGIAPGLRERIFERYVQLENTQATRGGRGLGLAFAKLAMRAHGGDVCVVDGPESGACFSVSLP